MCFLKFIDADTITLFVHMLADQMMAVNDGLAAQLRQQQQQQQSQRPALLPPPSRDSSTQMDSVDVVADTVVQTAGKQLGDTYDSTAAVNDHAQQQHDQLLGQLTNLERDNFYYRQINRDLKQKLREFVAVHEKHLDALKRSKDARQALKRENAQLRKQMLESSAASPSSAVLPPLSNV